MNTRQIILIVIVVLLLGLGAGLWLSIPQIESYSPFQTSSLEEVVYQSNTVAVEIRFTRRMQADSVIDNLTISPQVEGDYTWPDENTLRFVPSEVWPSGAQVEVKLDTGARSNLGLGLRQPLTYSFQVSPVLLLYLWPASGGSDIYTMDTETGETQQLTNSGNIVSFDTSPDGHILYYFVDNNITGNDLFYLDRFEAVTAESEQTIGPSRLLTCQRALCGTPVVSPDGRLLAYQRNDSEIWLMEIENPADAVQVSPEGEDCRLPLWSPTGELSYYNATRQAYIVLNIESEEEISIENATGEEGAWSPRGTAFVAPDAFIIETDILRGPSGEAENQEIPEEELEPVRVLSAHLLVYQTGGSQVQDLSQDELVEDFSPSFSPDGRTLAFTRRYLTEEPIALGRQVWLRTIQGGGASAQALPLTDHPDYKYTLLVWHPDGRQLAAVRFNQAVLTDPPEIWLLDLNGNAIRLIIGGYAPQWTP
jgi:Tol biopolymer transport system component